MSEISEALVDAIRLLQEQESDSTGLAPVFDWGGLSDIPCAAGAQHFMKSLGIGGFGLDADLVLVVVLSDIVPGYETSDDLTGNIPASKQKLTYLGKQYRVEGTTIPPGLGVLVLACLDPTKGV